MAIAPNARKIYWLNDAIRISPAHHHISSGKAQNSFISLPLAAPPVTPSSASSLNSKVCFA
jgi:hypothetical protein